MIWKDFFFFSKGEKNGLLVLGCLTCLMFAVNFCFSSRSQHQNSTIYTREEQRKIDSLISEIHLRDSLLALKQSSSNKSATRVPVEATRIERENQLLSNNHGVKRVIAEKRKFPKIELNSADSAALVQLYGIGPVLSRRIIKYRTSLGGRFHSVEQLKNVYGLSEETFQNILPHVWIDTLNCTKPNASF